MKKNKERLKEYSRLWRLGKTPEEMDEFRKKWKKADPEYHKEYGKLHYDPKRRKEYYDKNREREMWHAARYRAKRDNLPFDLELSDIIIPEMCPVLNIPLDRKTKDTTPTLDKKIPEKGYTKTNVFVISWRANRIKNNGSLEEHKAIVKYLEK